MIRKKIEIGQEWVALLLAVLLHVEVSAQGQSDVERVPFCDFTQVDSILGLPLIDQDADIKHYKMSLNDDELHLIHLDPYNPRSVTLVTLNLLSKEISKVSFPVTNEIIGGLRYNARIRAFDVRKEKFVFLIGDRLFAAQFDQPELQMIQLPRSFTQVFLRGEDVFLCECYNTSGLKKEDKCLIQHRSLTGELLSEQVLHQDNIFFSHLLRSRYIRVEEDRIVHIANDRFEGMIYDLELQPVDSFRLDKQAWHPLTAQETSSLSRIPARSVHRLIGKLMSKVESELSVILRVDWLGVDKLMLTYAPGNQPHSFVFHVDVLERQGQGWSRAHEHVELSQLAFDTTAAVVGKQDINMPLMVKPYAVNEHYVVSLDVRTVVNPVGLNWTTYKQKSNALTLTQDPQLCVTIARHSF